MEHLSKQDPRNRVKENGRLQQKSPLKPSLHHQQHCDLIGNYDHLLPSGNIWANTSVSRHISREIKKKEERKQDRGGRDTKVPGLLSLLTLWWRANQVDYRVNEEMTL